MKLRLLLLKSNLLQKLKKFEKGDNLDVANTNSNVYLKLSQNPQEYNVALARTIGVKEHVS